MLKLDQNWEEILAKELMRILDPAMEVGEVNARSIAPVDTGSYRQSIYSEVSHDGAVVRGELTAGGEDYSGSIIASTGREGKAVDYASEVEARSSVIAQSAPVILSELGQ